MSHISKKELKKIAKNRLEEAKLLHLNHHYDGAVYLAGYVLEIALKARICKHLKVENYPDNIHKDAFKIHQVDKLLLLSGLSNQINPTNKDLFDNWNLLTSWQTEFRYKPIGTATREYSEDILKALEDGQYGLFNWIKKRW